MDPDCLAEAAVDARWSYEGNEYNVMGFLCLFLLTRPSPFELDGNNNRTSLMESISRISSICAEEPKN